MNPTASLAGIGLIAAGLALLSLVEAVIPLHRRSAWNRRHLAPNLILTAITIAAGLALNIAILIALVFLQARGLGLLNLIRLPPALGALAGVAVLDLAWYATHVTLHRVPALWRIHRVHHSDPAVDVTTTIRQHPLEGLVRYAFLLAFGAVAGVSPAAFALYRVWSALHGQLEHANIRLPAWLDRTIALVFTSPDAHKVHHAREAALTDSNYGNIFSLWDRAFASFTDPALGRTVTCGLDGFDDPADQTALGLLSLPFRRPAAQPVPAAAAEPEAA